MLKGLPRALESSVSQPSLPAPSSYLRSRTWRLREAISSCSTTLMLPALMLQLARHSSRSSDCKPLPR